MRWMHFLLFFPTIAENLIGNDIFASEYLSEPYDNEEYLDPGNVTIICTIGGDCIAYPNLEPDPCP